MYFFRSTHSSADSESFVALICISSNAFPTLAFTSRAFSRTRTESRRAASRAIPTSSSRRGVASTSYAPHRTRPIAIPQIVSACSSNRRISSRYVASVSDVFSSASAFDPTFSTCPSTSSARSSRTCGSNSAASDRGASAARSITSRILAGASKMGMLP